MKSYGTAVIIDGVFVKNDALPNDPSRRGMVRYSENTRPEITPKIVVNNSESTFVVDLYYRDYKRNFKEGVLQQTNSVVEFKKTIRRIAPTNRSISELKKTVAEYAGPIEAGKLRRRSIALGKIHKTISGEIFKFPLPSP